MKDNKYLIGYDIGSSSIKAALVSVDNGRTIAIAHAPGTEMEIQAPHPGWAEQNPELWWSYVCQATHQLLSESSIPSEQIAAVGIAYQMHGLVAVDQGGAVVRPSIIWCDGRAVPYGDRAFQDLGATTCLTHLLNSPGNFTASKLKWVQDQEPENYHRIHKIMLPGDYIAYRLTNKLTTTVSGLSEGTLWDFGLNEPAQILLDYYGFDVKVLPELVPTVGVQGYISIEAAAATGLPAGIPVGYRAGDQPNNALSLNVLEPGEVAATGGTSGVVYAVVDQYIYDGESRVNGFAHVNHQADDPRVGILLCINGAGILYSWIRKEIAPSGTSYQEMENAAASVPVGADGLRILPFGNGAERMLSNQQTGVQWINLQLNRHKRAHIYRAALEGIAFAFVYGMQILKRMGVDLQVIRVGNDNLFQSRIFSETIANLTGSTIEVLDTTGAVGAAKAAGVAAGCYTSIREAVQTAQVIHSYRPQQHADVYRDAYELWEKDLMNQQNETVTV
ncbi:MAG: carbohydrate kinase [Saprospiraceae bacterium]|nr:carbohydrate kinase [Saprospiraceae bacterium]MCB9318040.1 carbohydrate kinase [Lewinellaceae bacterium]